MTDNNVMFSVLDTGSLQEDAAGRILATQGTSEAVQKQAAAEILGAQDASVLEANVIGGIISASGDISATQSGAEGSARQLMQIITPAGFNRTHYLAGLH